MKIGLVYGSTTGNTEDAADLVRGHFAGHVAESLEVSSTDLAALTDFDTLLVGVSTWNIGELQQDWDAVFADLTDLDFTGVRVAFFGAGDQSEYPENFQDAMGILRNRIIELGGRCDIGHWPVDGYEFEDSVALVDGRFCGLALDEDNQPEQTEDRVAAWCEQLKGELELAS